MNEALSSISRDGDGLVPLARVDVVVLLCVVQPKKTVCTLPN
jgi:hypothetical protein